MRKIVLTEVFSLISSYVFSQEPIAVRAKVTVTIKEFL